MTMQINAVASYSIDPQLMLQPGDPAEEAAALAVQSGLESETTQSEIEQSEEQLAASESSAQVQAMRSKANEARTAGILDGCVGMSEGALQGGTAACDVAAAGTTTGSASALKAEGEWFKAGATGLESGGKLFDGLEQGAALSDDATAKADGDAADRASQAAKDAHDAASADQSAVNSAVQVAGQIEQAQASTNLTLAQRV